VTVLHVSSKSCATLPQTSSSSLPPPSPLSHNPLAMNPAVTNLMVSLGAMQGTQYSQTALALAHAPALSHSGPKDSV
jgi:hypothetical protein